MKIILACDAQWYDLTQQIIKILEKEDIWYYCNGASNNKDNVQLDVFLHQAAQEIIDEKTFWIFVSGNGIDMNIWANKTNWVRATLCSNFNQARWAREENNVNVLCIAAWEEEYLELNNIIKTFIKSEFKNKDNQELFSKIENNSNK